MQELAAFGGPRTVAPGLVQTWPPLTQEDRDAVMAVFDSNILHGTSAPNALALQKEFAEWLGVKYCLVTNSGTSALHMAVASLGIGPGDEVIVPGYTFIASMSSIIIAREPLTGLGVLGLILIGNKADLFDGDRGTLGRLKGLSREYATACLLTSAKSGARVEEAFLELSRRIEGFA